MERAEKREFVASLAETLGQTSFVLVAQNKGLTVAAVLLMRRFWRGWRRGDWTRAAAPG